MRIADNNTSYSSSDSKSEPSHVPGTNYIIDAASMIPKSSTKPAVKVPAAPPRLTGSSLHGAIAPSGVRPNVVTAGSMKKEKKPLSHIVGRFSDDINEAAGEHAKALQGISRQATSHSERLRARAATGAGFSGELNISHNKPSGSHDTPKLSLRERAQGLMTRIENRQNRLNNLNAREEQVKAAMASTADPNQLKQLSHQLKVLNMRENKVEKNLGRAQNNLNKIQKHHPQVIGAINNGNGNRNNQHHQQATVTFMGGAQAPAASPAPVAHQPQQVALGGGPARPNAGGGNGSHNRNNGGQRPMGGNANHRGNGGNASLPVAQVHTVAMGGGNGNGGGNNAHRGNGGGPRKRR